MMIGEAVTNKNLPKFLAEFEENHPAEAPSPKRVEDILQFLRNYPLPFFSKHKLTELNEVEVTKLFDWRRKNFKRKPQEEGRV